MIYKIFQVKSDKVRDFGFMGLEQMKALKVPVLSQSYDQVWEGTANGFDNDETLLQSLFNAFNNNDYPTGYKGRSMSVSDIIAIADNDGGSDWWTYYFCEPYGWEEIEPLESEVD